MNRIKVISFILVLLAGAWFLVSSAYSATMLVPDGITLPSQTIRLMLFHTILPILGGLSIALFFSYYREEVLKKAKYDANSLQNIVVYIVSITLGTLIFIPFSFQFEGVLADNYQQCYRESSASNRGLSEYLYVKNDLECPGREYLRENKQGLHGVLEISR